MTEHITNAPWTLRRRVVAMCLLLGVVLAFLATGATITAIANRGQLDTLLDTVGPMRAAGDSLATDLLNQETSVRGYVLSGNVVDLDLYRYGVRDERVQAQNIASSPAATPAVRQQLAAVLTAVEQWRNLFADPAIAAVQRGDQDAAAALLNDTARDRFGAVRQAMDTLRSTLGAIRDRAGAGVKDTSSTLLFVLIVAVIMVVAAGVSLLVALQRTVIEPVTDLAAQVRSVSRGNYRQQIITDGPPELRNLANDVDTMRQRIASDLAEVMQARGQIEEAHLALEQQAAELVRSNRDLEQFAYVASHDLQEPLRKVASFCQLLQRRYEGQLDEKADQYIDFAVSGAQRMQRLINDLLTFSRIGRNTAGFIDVDLAQMVSDAAVQIDSGDVPAEVTWSDLPVIRGEETLLTTLFANLISNAVKFRRPGITPAMHISGRREGSHWEISCADNGIGIEPEYAEKVFVIFQRLHPRDAYPGTGIGLAIAKKIVEYHGGDIWIDSEQSEGTLIRFTLPAIHAQVAARLVPDDDVLESDVSRAKEPAT